MWYMIFRKCDIWYFKNVIYDISKMWCMIFRKCDIWYFENVIYDICFASLGHRWHQRCVAWILIHSSFLLLFWCGKNVRLVAIISYYLEFALFFHHLQMLLQISLLTMQCDNWQERVRCGNNIIADSAQTEYCTTFPLSIRPCVRHRRDISHFSHI